MSTDAAVVAAIAEDLPVAVWVARAPGGELVYANRLFAEIMGMAARDDVEVGGYAGPYGICGTDGKPYPEGRMPFVRALEERTTVTVDDIVIHRHDGRKVHVRAQAKPIPDGRGGISHVVIAFIDITREAEAERAHAEARERLEHGRKMESVGRLAGGIAHDFNNILAAVQLIASTLRLEERDARRAAALAAIEEATTGGLELVRALLGFARRGKNLSARVPVDEVAAGVARIVSHAVAPRIEVRTELAEGEVIGDHAQLEQVAMNLAVNARDAIPGEGRIAVRTRRVALDGPAAAALPPLRAGPHVLLEVEDSGTGIPPEIRARIFEPYFTTKTTGTVGGNGLGLATVYGIVESHGGAIDVAAATPQGTIMRVFLPEAPPGERRRAAAAPAARIRPGSGTILLVDDEPLVAAGTAEALRVLGYEVVAARSGHEALALFDARGDVDGVVLDLVMPGLSGRETFLALRERDPAVRVLLTSGFARNEEAQALLDLGARAFLAKPFDVARLSEALADVLAAR